jgi:DNA-binding LacI/PurR family transcriptional regulator
VGLIVVDDPPQVSLRDLARHVGVSAMTVSRALRGLPQVSEDVRQRVLIAAARLGYVPDPALAVLNGYRHRGRTAKVLSRLAYLASGPARDPGQVTFRAAEFAAIQRAAQRLGYVADMIEVPQEATAERAAAARLLDLGISGIVLESGMEGWSDAALDWSKFAVVAIFSGQDRLHFPYVDLNQFATAEIVARRLRERGYRRPGIAGPVGRDLLSFRALVAAAQAALGPASGFEPVTPLLPGLDGWNAGSWARWLDNANPDVVVSLVVESSCNWIRVTGREVPRDVGFCTFDLRVADGTTAGIHQHRDQLAGLAVDLVHHQLVLGHRGLPAEPMCLSMPGMWIEGRTLRAPA